MELVLDLGRLPEARYPDRGEMLADTPVTREDIAYVVGRIGRFGKDNRAGIERTLHRISAIRNRVGDVIGLTCRVGRAVFGTVDILRDVIEAGQSILLLGPARGGQDHPAARGRAGAGRRARQAGDRGRHLQRDRRRRRRAPSRHRPRPPHAGALARTSSTR